MWTGVTTDDKKIIERNKNDNRRTVVFGGGSLTRQTQNQRGTRKRSQEGWKQGRSITQSLATVVKTALFLFKRLTNK